MLGTSLTKALDVQMSLSHFEFAFRTSSNACAFIHVIYMACTFIYISYNRRTNHIVGHNRLHDKMANRQS